jgi:hypothetical protein
MSPYRKLKDREDYSKHWIDKKLVRAINANRDNRYYLFRNVLSSHSVTAVRKVLPKKQLYIIANKRKYDQDGHRKLTNQFRNLTISYRKPKDPSNMQQQEMTVSQFYKVVASKLGIFGENAVNTGERETTSACLAEYDKLIKHEANLEVFVFYNEDYTDIKI